jgi:hypothetical protein
MTRTRSRPDVRTILTAEVLLFRQRRREAETASTRLSVRAYIRARANEWPTTHHGQVYPVKRSTMYENFLKLERHVHAGRPAVEWQAQPRGPRRTLNDEQERLAVKRISQLARTYSGVTLQMVRGEVEAVAALRLPGEKEASGGVQRVMRCGGREHLASFRKRHGIKTSRSLRPLEKERVLAQQPELRVAYYRHIYQAHALAHAHRRWLEFQSLEVGSARHTELKHQLRNYSMNGGVLEYNYDGDGDGVLGVKDEEFWLPDLGEKLVYTSPAHVVNGDEKPFNPNLARSSSVSTASVRANVQSGARSAYWTVMCWVRANGDALSPLVIIDGQSVHVDHGLHEVLERSLR